MSENADKRQKQIEYDKRLIPTGLTPEVKQGEAEFLHYRKLGQQSLLMNKLTTQILKRQQYVETENNKEMENAKMLIQDGKRSMEATQMQKQNDRDRAKQHWQEELQRT